jgi:hypothetical protein
MGNEAFSENPKLSTLICLNPTPPAIAGGSINHFRLINPGAVLFVRDEAAVTAYKANATWFAAFGNRIFVHPPPPTVGSPQMFPTATHYSATVQPGFGFAINLAGITEPNRTIRVYYAIKHNDYTIYRLPPITLTKTSGS